MTELQEDRMNERQKDRNTEKTNMSQDELKMNIDKLRQKDRQTKRQ